MVVLYAMVMEIQNVHSVKLSIMLLIIIKRCTKAFVLKFVQTDIMVLM